MKLNEFIEEKVPIKVHSLNDKGELEEKTEWHTQKVMYLDPKRTKIVCKPGDHNWYSKNIHTYLFACHNCKRTVRAFPVSYNFKDGVLTHKETGEVV